MNNLCCKVEILFILRWYVISLAFVSNFLIYLNIICILIFVTFRPTVLLKSGKLLSPFFLLHLALNSSVASFLTALTLDNKTRPSS